MSAGVSRALAIVAAIALVAGAWWVRTNLIEDSTDSSRDQIASGSTLALSCDPAVAVCAELGSGDAATIDGVEVRVEPPGTTTRRFAENDNPPDLWITADVWVLVAQAAESPDVAVDLFSDPFGEISLFGLATPPKLARLGQLCPELNVDCIGGLAGSKWGEPDVADVADRFDLGIDPPGTTASLVTVADATIGWSGVERPDITAFDGVRAKVAAMLRSSVPVRAGSTATREFAATPAAFDFITTTDGTTELEGGSIEPIPLGGLRTSVVLAGRHGLDADAAVDAVAAALESLGVEITPSDTATLENDSLPNGATLEAMWNQTTEEYPS